MEIGMRELITKTSTEIAKIVEGVEKGRGKEVFSGS